MTHPPTTALRRHLTAAAVVLLLVGLGSVALAAPAAAHAALQETSPADGAVIDTSPGEVVLTFNEPVTVTIGAVRVYDADGTQVDAGDAGLGTNDTTLRVSLRDGLDQGTYVVTWAATSADAHPIRGAFVYDVGAAGGADEARIAAIFAQATQDDVGTGIAAAVGRWLVYAGAFLAVGGTVFMLRVHDGRAGDRRLLTRPVRWGAGVALVATVLGIGVQAALLTGLGPAAALDPTVLREVVASSYGTSALVRALALAVLLAAVPRLHRPAGAVVASAAGAIVLVSFALTGHTVTTEPRWLVTVADVAHTAAGAAWSGGLVLLLLALRRRRLEDDPVGGARLVSRYSTLATGAIALVAVAGTALSVVQVRAPAALFSTTYGWTLLAKLGVVALVVAAGAHNHRTLVPAVAGTVARTRARATAPDRALQTVPAAASDGASGGVATLVAPDDEGLTGDGPSMPRPADPRGTPPASGTPEVRPEARDAWARLARTVRLEVVGIAAVLLVTAVLVTLVPARTEAGVTGVFSEYAPLGDEYQVNLTVDPNRAGRNELHLYLLSDSGQPVDIAGDLTLAFSQAENRIAAIERTPTIAGPGHWTMEGNELSIPGTWTVEVTARVSEFDQLTTQVEVPVQP